MNGALPSKLPQIYKKMIGKKQYSRLGHASQARSQGSTIYQKIIKRRTPEHRLDYQIFFSLNLFKKEVLNSIN